MLMIETMNNQNAKKMFKLEPKKQLITRKQPKPQNPTLNLTPNPISSDVHMKSLSEENIKTLEEQVKHELREELTPIIREELLKTMRDEVEVMLRDELIDKVIDDLKNENKETTKYDIIESSEEQP